MTDEQMAAPDTEDLTPEALESGEEAATSAGSADVDLGRVRELVLAAHPDVVPEMVQGATFDELMSSVQAAREAYQRIASEATQSRGAPRVAAQPSQRSASLVDMEALSPLGKISEGLRRM
jgi:hypothetical protein